MGIDKPKQYLPKDATLVFRGKNFEVWQWEQEMYDGTKKIFEKVKKRNAVSVIAIVEDKIIIQEQEQPHRDMFISLPGGGCELDEDLAETARRELLEETGYVSENMTFRKSVPSAYSSLIHEEHYFIAKDCQKVQEMNLDNGEKIENKLVSFEEFILLSEDERFREVNLKGVLLRMRLHPEEEQIFKTLLFSR